VLSQVSQYIYWILLLLFFDLAPEGIALAIGLQKQVHFYLLQPPKHNISFFHNNNHKQLRRQGTLKPLLKKLVTVNDKKYPKTSGKSIIIF
jgi:hypothetical protein